MISSDTQPVQNLRVLVKYQKDMGGDVKHKIHWGHYWIEHAFKGLEAMLVKTAGKYCVGDQVTVADACLVPQVYNANRFKIDMSQFPTISRINAELIKLDAFKAAHPDSQPDMVPQ
jgi:maleylacetoacetate isomerase